MMIPADVVRRLSALAILMLATPEALSQTVSSGSKDTCSNSINYGLPLLIQESVALPDQDEVERTVRKIVEQIQLELRYANDVAVQPDDTVANLCASILDTGRETKRTIHYQYNWVAPRLREGNAQVIAAIAHEFGHILLDHADLQGRDVYRAETAADEAAGAILQKLAVPLEAALLLFQNYPEVNAGTHPPKSMRLYQMSRGYGVSPLPLSSSSSVPVSVEKPVFDFFSQAEFGTRKDFILVRLGQPPKIETRNVRLAGGDEFHPFEFLVYEERNLQFAFAFSESEELQHIQVKCLECEYLPPILLDEGRVFDGGAFFAPAPDLTAGRRRSITEYVRSRAPLSRAYMPHCDFTKSPGAGRFKLILSDEDWFGGAGFIEDPEQIHATGRKGFAWRQLLHQYTVAIETSAAHDWTTDVDPAALRVFAMDTTRQDRTGLNEDIETVRAVASICSHVLKTFPDIPLASVAVSQLGLGHVDLELPPEEVLTKVFFRDFHLRDQARMSNQLFSSIPGALCDSPLELRLSVQERGAWKEDAASLSSKIETLVSSGCPNPHVLVEARNLDEFVMDYDTDEPMAYRSSVVVSQAAAVEVARALQYGQPNFTSLHIYPQSARNVEPRFESDRADASPESAEPAVLVRVHLKRS